MIGSKRIQGTLIAFTKQHEVTFKIRQINGIHQHLVGLHPFFQAMRATLKALTQHVNPQWEVKTPTTPAKMQHGKGCDRH